MHTMSDLKKLSVSDLKAKLKTLKTDLFNKNFNSYTVGIQKPHELKILKKDIARILTTINVQKNNK